jgi:hypothetical protein
MHEGVGGAEGSGELIDPKRVAGHALHACGYARFRPRPDKCPHGVPARAGERAQWPAKIPGRAGHEDRSDAA